METKESTPEDAVPDEPQFTCEVPAAARLNPDAPFVMLCGRGLPSLTSQLNFERFLWEGVRVGVV